MPRTPDLPNRNQMLRIARLYYVDGLTKQEISGRLNIDARKVTSLLDEARQTGIVKISLHGGSGETELEQRLRDRFSHLQKVMILPGPKIAKDKYPALFPQWGVMAAQYFDDVVQNHLRRNAVNRALHVGISGGETLLEFVRAVPELSRPDVHIHATAIVGHGGIEMSASHIDPVTNATLLWINCGRLDGHCHYATTAPYEATKKGSDVRDFINRKIKDLARNEAIKEVIDGMKDLDIAFTGVGTYRPPAEAANFKNRLTMMSLLEPLVSLKELGREAVGDLSYCTIDENGAGSSKWQFFLTAGYGSEHSGVDFYRNMVQQGKPVVAIAGPYKIDPIRAALKGKLFNVWITDEDSARQIIDQS